MAPERENRTTGVTKGKATSGPVRDHRTNKTEMLAKAQKLTRDDVLQELRKNNITTLDELVDARLAAVQDIGKPVARSDGFLYKAFIFWSSDYMDASMGDQKAKLT